jgi:hypothetical protein
VRPEEVGDDHAAVDATGEQRVGQPLIGTFGPERARFWFSVSRCVIGEDEVASLDSPVAGKAGFEHRFVGGFAVVEPTRPYERRGEIRIALSRLMATSTNYRRILAPQRVPFTNRQRATSPKRPPTALRFLRISETVSPR